MVGYCAYVITVIEIPVLLFSTLELELEAMTSASSTSHEKGALARWKTTQRTAADSLDSFIAATSTLYDQCSWNSSLVAPAGGSLGLGWAEAEEIYSEMAGELAGLRAFEEKIQLGTR